MGMVGRWEGFVGELNNLEARILSFVGYGKFFCQLSSFVIRDVCGCGGGKVTLFRCGGIGDGMGLGVRID